MKAFDKSSRVQRMTRDLPLVSTVMGGTSAMRDAGETYLPKFPAEDSKVYANRLAQAVLFPALENTVTTLSGLPFGKPLTVSNDMPEMLAEYLTTIDQEEHDIGVFAHEITQAALTNGVTYILADYPVAEGMLTMADQQNAGLRPYLCHIKVESVLGWKAGVINGRTQLTQFRFMETYTEDDGLFGEVERDQVKVLMPGMWQIWRKNDENEEYLYAEGTTTLGYIPLVPVYGKRTGFMCGEPPLVELAHMNVEHFQSSSDQQNILHVARVPMLTIIGATGDTNINAGAQSVTLLPEGGDMKWVEHSGAAIGAGRQSILDLEERMRQCGAQLMTVRPGAVTATQVQMDSSESMSQMQAIVKSVQDGLNIAIGYMADWLGMVAGTVKIDLDFAINPSSQDMETLERLFQAGVISKQTYHAEAIRRGLVSEASVYTEEAEMIAQDAPPIPQNVMPFNQAARLEAI